MLVLCRREGQSVVIGENTRIQILGFRENGQIRLGIEAPVDVAVHREEIYELINKKTHPTKFKSKLQKK